MNSEIRRASLHEWCLLRQRSSAVGLIDSLLLGSILTMTGLAGSVAMQITVRLVGRVFGAGEVNLPEGASAFGAAAVVAAIAVVMVRGVMAQNTKMVEHILEENRRLKQRPTVTDEE